MKRRKILYFIPLVGLLLTGCYLKEGFIQVKSWAVTNLVDPLKDSLDNIFGNSMAPEKDEQKEEKPSGEQQGEEQGGEHGGEEEKPEHVHTYGDLVPGVEADCENSGHAAYYHCEECDKYFTSEKEETTLEALQVEALGHTYSELIAEIPATCESDGVKAHYECERCHQLFDVEKEKIDASELIIAAHGHVFGDLIPALAADCENPGHAAYYHCEECDKYFDSEKHETSLDALTIAALGHDYGELIPGIPATCESTGTLAHYECSICHQLFDSEKNKITEGDLVIAAHGHEFGDLIPALAADCENPGHAAYYHCEECDKYFDLEKQETSLDALTIAALGHSAIEHPAKVASCLEAGNSLYYECERCHHFFSDSECEHEIVENSWVIEKLAHNPIQHLAVSPNCTSAGSSEYYECSECHHFFSDASCQNEIAENSWVIPANGHTAVHHASTAPSYSPSGATNGNSEYYECSVCNHYFSDAACEHEILENSWVIPANLEAYNKELASEDYLFFSEYASANFGSNDKYILDRFSTDTANANSGFAFYMPVSDSTTGWPNFTLTLPNAVDLSHGSFEISAKTNNLTNLQIGLKNSSDEAVLKWNLSNTGLTSSWQTIKFTVPANQIADGKDLTSIKKLVFNFNFDQNSGTERAMWLDELHFGEGAYANGSSAYNLEMGTYSGGQWRGNGSTATTIYNDTASASSKSALKVTFQDHNTSWSSLPGRVFASFDLAQTTGIGSSNTIDVKNSTLSFDIKLSQEFYDTNNSQFTFKHEDSSWAGIEKWYAFTGYTSGNPQTWLHVSVDLSAKYGSETRNANTYAITFGFFGMTTETIQSAWVIFDNVSIVANS